MGVVKTSEDNLYHALQGFKEGWGIVTAARVIVFQFPPAKEAKFGKQVGDQDPPSTFVQLTIQPMQDGNGNKAPLEPSEKLLGVQKPDQMGVLRCFPGTYVEGSDFKEAVGSGPELGAEGDTIYTDEDGFAISDNSPWWRFAKSLIEDGFKPAILARTYMPDLVGLYACFKSITLPKFRDNMESNPTAFIVEKGSTKVRPYEAKDVTAGAVKGKKQTGSSPKPSSAPASNAGSAPATASAPTPAQTETSTAGDTVDPEDLATAVVTSTLAKKLAGQTLPSIARVKAEAFIAMNEYEPVKNADASIKKAVQDKLKDAAWLTAVGESNDVFSIDASNKVVFA